MFGIVVHHQHQLELGLATGDIVSLFYVLDIAVEYQSFDSVLFKRYVYV